MVRDRIDSPEKEDQCLIHVSVYGQLVPSQTKTINGNPTASCELAGWKAWKSSWTTAPSAAVTLKSHSPAKAGKPGTWAAPTELFSMASGLAAPANLSAPTTFCSAATWS